MSREGLAVHARRPAVRTAERVGVGEDVFAPHLVVQDSGTAALGSCLAFTYSARWSLRIFSGVARLTPISLSSARSSAPRTRAPSLHRHYPASSVRMSPSDSCRARPPKEPLPGRPGQPDRPPVLPVTACVRAAPTTPASRSDLHVSVHPVALGGLRPLRGDSALAFNLSRPAQASLALRPVRLLTRPERASVPGASTGRSPSPPPG